jgi:hypothetical protein
MTFIHASQLYQLSCRDNKITRKTWRKRSSKQPGSIVAQPRSESCYLQCTSPNKARRIGILENGKIEIWNCMKHDESNIPIMGKAVSAYVNDGAGVRFERTDAVCAVLDENGHSWLWGNYIFRKTTFETFCWVMGSTSDPIVHIDPTSWHITMTGRSGRLYIVGESKHWYDSIHARYRNNVAMTSSSGRMENHHVMILSKDGWLECIGENDYGQCEVPHRGPFASVEAGDGFSSALTMDGRVVLWGNLKKARRWSSPWRLSEESMLQFVYDYGHVLDLRRLPKKMKRTIGYRQVRMLQRMAMS